MQNVNALASGSRFAIAAILAFIFYNYFDLTFGFWAVVTVAAVMRPNVKMTNMKGFLRLLGTLVGVFVGVIAIDIIKISPDLLFLAFFLAMLVTGLLIFYCRTYSYLGIVCGITAIIIITTYDQTPTLFYNVIVDRTVDVIVGILIGWACSKWLFPSTATSNDNVLVDQSLTAKSLFTRAIIMASATTLSLLPWFKLHYLGGFWAPIACLFIVEENLDKTQRKALGRFFAHIIVVLLASIFSFFSHNAYEIGLALGVGMFLFGYWMQKPLLGFGSEISNSMAIAYSIVLLAAPQQLNILENVIARFLNTVLGILIGMIVVSIFHFSNQNIKRKSGT